MRSGVQKVEHHLATVNAGDILEGVREYEKLRGVKDGIK